jgi:hypothetical protein
MGEKNKILAKTSDVKYHLVEHGMNGMQNNKPKLIPSYTPTQSDETK